jgi:hypothetical protein
MRRGQCGNSAPSARDGSLPARGYRLIAGAHGILDLFSAQEYVFEQSQGMLALGLGRDWMRQHSTTGCSRRLTASAALRLPGAAEPPRSARVLPAWKGGTPATVVIGKIAFEFLIHAWYKWRCRRSQRTRLTWERFTDLLRQLPLPRPRITVRIWGG